MPAVTAAYWYPASGPPVLDYVHVVFDMDMQALSPVLNVGRIIMGSATTQLLHSSWLDARTAVLLPVSMISYSGTPRTFELFSDSGYLSVAGVSPVDQTLPAVQG